MSAKDLEAFEKLREKLLRRREELLIELSSINRTLGSSDPNRSIGGRPRGSLKPGSQSERILAFALEHPGHTSRDIATELQLRQTIVTAALFTHISNNALTRVREGRIWRYWGPVTDKESTDGGSDAEV